MRNLKEETLAALLKHGQAWDDVVAIQGRDFRISRRHFLKLADVEYDPGYGSQEVASDLVILMRDGSWFTRAEYDGSEWWAYHKAPERLQEVSDDKVHSLVCSKAQVGWCALKEINTEDKRDEEK